MTARRDRLVTLVGKGRRPVCVMLPGAGGGLTPYLRVAGHLGRDRNVHGVLPTGVLPGGEPERDLATMAESAVGVLDAAGLRPDLVFGWSFGGVLAWEVGHALSRTGPPPRLVIVDSSPLPRRATPAEDEDIRRRVLAHLGPRPKPDVVDRVLATFTAQVDALREHRAERRYDGPVMVRMCAPWDTEEVTAATRRWAELCADLTTGTLAAGHFEVFDPGHLPELVAALDDFLGDAR
ncbi:MAG: thioesterase [Streptomycetaceae bacterium]|nr:thioesterase [Streptomycetaceae bacterium]